MKAIHAFSLTVLGKEINGQIDENLHEIKLTVPRNADITSLIPNISISDKASITPALDIAQDFNSPVTYTVTAEDGSLQTYQVSIIFEKSTDCQILTFGLKNINPIVTGEIDQNQHTILLRVPSNQDVTALVPEISLSEGASISPLPE